MNIPTQMVLKGKYFAVLAHTLILYVGLVFLGGSSSFANESDIYCLRTIKDSLEYPYNHLSSSWNFENNTEGFICKFNGVECWHPDENRVLNISLSDMGLKGEFPHGIGNCTSLASLDLSSNKLSGSIPSDISDKLPFVTSLNLSSNSFSGEIPLSLANCTYLNVLKLDHNQLTGMIPPQLARPNQIKKFSVSNNLLSRPVPSFDSTVTAKSYANNIRLCGGPLKSCQSTTNESDI
ncbi:hypothetical protein I3843_07G081900 [Carya illinoinensis]|nr:hypothetical protein I3843_07G081900 [Carya illinoinensis]